MRKEFSFNTCIIFYPLYEDRYNGHMPNILHCKIYCINESHKVYLKLDWLTRHSQAFLPHASIYQCQMELSDHVFTAHNLGREEP